MRQHILNIKDLAAEDRPREKLLLQGKHKLSDSELLAIIIGSGSRNESAVSLAQRILNHNKQSLQLLGKCSIHDLIQFKGIGEAKAIAIVAALELGRRRQTILPKKRNSITCSNDAYRILVDKVVDLPHEEFWILLLNKSNHLIHKECVSTGGLAGTVVDSRLIFKLAIEKLASSIVLCHNHPSGNLKPSKTDIETTNKLVLGAKSLDLAIFDHLIISEFGYFSFADAGII